ncbi:aminoglycoside phosphotransferase family protein [Streptomyces sp. NBC_01298]|uniref:aminoglycoside phosphotransferase family protein n=1 Tax=Streptomyces sp. NBC_01298 TaxID=2903817 RepID=UPI002E1334A0|nr:aminoglycoside phosphotransferase family protein [Streptomyces sp. NBC_01298]
MLERKSDLDERVLERIVREQYEGAGPDLVFQPVGEDSWSYRCGSLWISVRRDLLGHVPEAYATAHALNRAGLDFVLAPLAGRDGRILRTVQGRPVAVFPYLEGEQVAAGPPLTRREVARIVELAERVHACEVPSGLPVEDFRLPFEERLIRALSLAVEPARDVGPYSERLRDMITIRSHFVDALLQEIAAVGKECAAARHTFGTSHGDLNDENVLRVADEFVFVDWQCAMTGPAERDGYFLTRELGAAVGGDPLVHRFYDLQWRLAEIAEYTITFTAEHEDTPDQQGRWRRLCQYMASP